MSDTTRIDLDGMRHDGARLAALGDRMGRTYARVHDGLARTEGCWGDDDLGKAFAEDFKPSADALLSNLRALAASMHATAQGITDAAQQFRDRDLDAANMIRTADDPAQPRPVAGAGPNRTTPPPALPPRHRGGNGDPGGESHASEPRAQAAGPAASRPDGTRRPDAAPIPGDGPRPVGADRPALATGPTTPAAPQRISASGAKVGQSGSGNAPPGRPGADAAGTGRTGTPWSGKPPHSPSGPAASAPPAARRPTADPRSGVPPRPTRSAAAPPGRDRRVPAERLGNEAATLGWLARALADRHNVRVLGFDRPGLDEAAVRGFAAAVDRVLTDYPAVALDLVEVADTADPTARDHGPVHWTCGPRGQLTTAPVRSITLDPGRAREPDDTDTESGSSTYAATVRELGRALDDAGACRARARARRALLVEYVRQRRCAPRTMAEAVAGYRRWRAEVTGTDPDAAGFDMPGALCGAFAEVVLRGSTAGSAAQALHTALVESAAQETDDAAG